MGRLIKKEQVAVYLPAMYNDHCATSQKVAGLIPDGVIGISN
jgi:hypothetical protein